MGPNVIATMKALEQGKHLEILKYCVEYLVEFKKENEKELHDVLSSDRQMMAEVSYMLKRYQANKAKENNNNNNSDNDEEDNDDDKENEENNLDNSKNNKRVKHGNIKN